MSGYILSEIEANRIVLVKGDDKVVVMLDDRQKTRTSEAPASPGTTRMGPGGAASFPQTSSPSPQAAPASARAVPTLPVPGMDGSGPQPVPPTPPSSAQAAPSPGPGIGAPGSGVPSQPSVSPSPQAAAASSSQGATLLGPSVDGSTPLSRRAKLQEVQRIKSERPMSPQ